MNNFIRKYRALILPGIAAFILFAAACTSVFAWLAGSRSAADKGMDLQIEGICEIAIENCCAYRFDDIEMNVIATMINDEVTSVNMSEYDNVFKERNQYTPLILRMTVSGFPEEDGGKLKINIPCTESDYKDGTGKVINALSNVSFVRCGLGLTSAKSADGYAGRELDEKDSIYNEAKAALTASLCDCCGYFCESGTKSESIVLTLPYSAYKNHITETDEKNCIVIYLEFDYDPELVTAYSDSYGTALAPSEFTADIGLITIE